MGMGHPGTNILGVIMFRRSLNLVLTAALMFASTQALAGESRTLCVFDPSGANGDIFQIMRPQRNLLKV